MTTPKPLLSPAELDALVDGLETGQVDTTPATTSAAAVKPYSLVANDTTSRSQLAALEMINDRFSRQFRGSLLTLLRQAVKVSVTPFEVMSFGAYIKSVPSPCNVNIVRYPPLRGYGLITIDPAVVYGAVDSFFGGRGGGNLDAPALRGFTPTEERIIQLILDATFNDLREAWSPVYALGTEYVSREINPAFAQVGEERETVVVSSFELELASGVSGKLTIMYPFSALKPIRLLLRGRLQAGERDEKQVAQWSRELADAVMDAELELVGQLTTFRMSALDLASINAGDTLWFKQPQGVKVHVQQVHLFDAEYGSMDSSMALRIQAVHQPKDKNAAADDLQGPQETKTKSADKQGPRSATRSAQAAGVTAA
jgi:flagellar motor switch protein FliM